MLPARTVTVLYFAAIRDAAGHGEERLELPENVLTVRDFAAFLQASRPALAGRLGSVRYAVNEVFAEDAAELCPGDVVAVIPPVSGG
jgi:molybdopterin synthase sulfur carrier subunit